MKTIFGISMVAAIMSVSAQASTYTVPMKPMASGVVCSDSGIDVLATASAERPASVKISANSKSKQIQVQAVKTGNTVTFTSGEGKLDVNFDRIVPGSDAVMGELDIEFEGARIHQDIPCRLLFMTGKQPSLKVWQ